jgi:hypothetical protein
MREIDRILQEMYKLGSKATPGQLEAAGLTKLEIDDGTRAAEREDYITDVSSSMGREWILTETGRYRAEGLIKQE